MATTNYPIIVDARTIATGRSRTTHNELPIRTILDTQDPTGVPGQGQHLFAAGHIPHFGQTGHQLLNQGFTAEKVVGITFWLPFLLGFVALRRVKRFYDQVRG